MRIGSLAAAAKFGFIALLAQGVAASAAEVKVMAGVAMSGAGVSATAKQPDAAKTLIKHLTTPEAAAVIRAKGMEPLGR